MIQNIQNPYFCSKSIVPVEMALILFIRIYFYLIMWYNSMQKYNAIKLEHATSIKEKFMRQSLAKYTETMSSLTTFEVLVEKQLQIQSVFMSTKLSTQHEI